MNQALIYGTEKNAEYTMKNILSLGGEVVGFCETKKEKMKFKGLPVYDINEIDNVDYDVIYIANSHIETLDNLLNKKIPKEKIVLDFNNIYGDKHLIFQYLKRNNFCLDIKCNAPFIMTREMSFIKELPYSRKINFCGNKLIFSDDYVRYGTLDLLVKEIKETNVTGDIAELGVYRGKFASLLNSYFPKRKLHLFDTFEGFDVRDTLFENDYSGSKAGRYGDTSVEQVMSLMKNPDNVLIYKGFFPDTIPKQEITFALVSLDCDLYKPILAGLEYFYPRLSNRGYIMLHDYNGGYGKGVHAAISTFENSNNIKLIKIPIPDEAGTVVISK